MAFDFPSSPTDGQVSNGYTWSAAKGAWVSGGSSVTGLIQIKKFTANGTYTPDPNLSFAIVEAQASGGGGGGAVGVAGSLMAAAGGGAGSYSRGILSAAQIGASQAVVVGNGGLGGTGDADGANGGDVALGLLVIAKGGLGGGRCKSGTFGTSGAGGIAGTGDITIPGGAGGTGILSNITTVWGAGNAGGNAVLGLGGVQLVSTVGVAPGVNGSFYGGGGSGSSVFNTATNAKGGDGAKGIIIITEFCYAAVTSSSGGAKGQCVLKKVGANLVLQPKDGNLLTVNGVNCTIPDAGVTLAPTTLTPGINYYVYAVATAGAITSLEPSATGYSISTTAGNKGVAIKTGDETRSLVGFARIITGPAWQDTVAQRFVRSWYNDKGIETQNAFTTARAVSVTSPAEVNTEIRNELLLWAGEAITTFLTGTGYNTTAGQANWCGVAIDNTTTIEPAGSYHNTPVISYAAALAATNNKVGLAEGYHFFTLLGWVSGGLFTFNAGGGAVVYTAIGSFTRGRP